MKIREYTRTDRDTCIDMFKSNIPKFFLHKEIKDYEDFLDSMVLGAYWVLENQGKIIACGGIGTRESEGRLHFGLVENSWHRKGVGSRLLKFRLAKLIQNPNVKAISLDTSQHNPEFFNRFGFQETSAQENYYGPGLHRHDMRLVLPLDQVERQKLVDELLAGHLN